MNTQRGWPLTRYEQMHMMLASAASGCVFLMAVVGVVSAFYPFQVFSQMNVRAVGSVTAGQPFALEMDYCKTSPIAPKRVIITMQDGIVVVLYTAPHHLEMGCHVVQVRDVMPAKVPGGTYRIEMLLVYEPWPWRTITYTYSTQPFEVRGAQ